MPNERITEDIDGYIDNGYTDENCISFACYGCIGEVFYHPEKVWVSDNCNVIYVKGIKLNNFIAMFLLGVLFKEQYKFSYGMTGKKERLKNLIIKLPVNADNVPDWQWIENYVKNNLVPKLPQKAKSVWNDNFDKEAVSNKKLSLNSENWQQFLLLDFFDMYVGEYYPKNSFSDGHTPLISSTKTENGVMAYTDLEPAFKGNCITIGKVGMTNFYQPFPFCATSDVTILVPKFEMSDYCALFIKTILDTEKYRWTYGNQIRLNDSQKIKIKLPTTQGSTPDWQFMEDYIKSLSYSKCI